MMNRVAVTGPAGFIGSNLIRKLSSEGKRIVAISRESSDAHNIDLPGVESVKYTDGDPGSAAALLGKGSIDCFYNLAWNGASGDARDDADRQNESVILSNGFADLCGEIGCRRFIGAGTVMEHRATTDRVALRYIDAKIKARETTREICLRNGTDHIWAYIPSTYGAGATSGFIHDTLRNLLNGEPAILRNPDSVYDFVDVRDVSNGLYLIGEKGKKNTGYYIGCGPPMKLIDFTTVMRNSVHTSVETAIPTSGKVDNGAAPGFLSFDRLTEDTGYRPSVDFETGIRNMIESMIG